MVIAVMIIHQYDKGLFAPVMSLVYPLELRKQVETIALYAILVCSFLITGVIFHYTRDLEKFQGRRNFRFPRATHRCDRHALTIEWIRIIQLLIFLIFSTMAFFPAYIFSITPRIANANSDVQFLYSCGLTATLCVIVVVRSRLLHHSSRAPLLTKINYLVHTNADPNRHRFNARRTRNDPFGWGRSEMARVASMLDRMARKQDSVVLLELQHPLGSVYRSASDYFKRYCASPESLRPQLPHRVLTVLIAVQLTLLDGDLRWQHYLCRRLEVFGDDGKPRQLITAPSLSMSARISRRVGHSIDRVNSSIQASWRTVLIALGLILFLVGRLSLDALLGIGK